MKIERSVTTAPGFYTRLAQDFVTRRLADGQPCRMPRAWDAVDASFFLNGLREEFDEQKDSMIDLQPLITDKVGEFVQTLRVIAPENIAIFQDELHALVLQKKLMPYRGSNDALPQHIITIEDPDSLSLISAAKNKDISRAALDIGQKTLQRAARHIMAACDRGSIFGFDPARNVKLARALQDSMDAGLDDSDITRILDYARQGYEEWPFFPDLASSEIENAAIKNILSIPDSFFETAITGHGFFTQHGHIAATEYVEKLSETIWSSGQPQISFRDRGILFSPANTTEQQPIFWLDLSTFVTPAADPVDVAGLISAVRVAVIALDAISEDDHLSLQIAGFAPTFMALGLAYDSDAARALASVLCATVSAAAEDTSAQLAQHKGGGIIPAQDKKWQEWCQDRLTRLNDTWGRAAWHSASLTRRSDGFLSLCKNISPSLWQTALTASRSALESTQQHGLCHHRLINIVPQTGLRPVQDVVDIVDGINTENKTTKRSYVRHLHPSAVKGLSRLGYTAQHIDDIHLYVAGHGTLLDAPAINHAVLQEKGISAEHILRIEYALSTARHIRQALTPYTTGMDTEDDLLRDLGFSMDDIETANLYACGAMTLEGAPHLKPEHLAVFDCLLPASAQSVRAVTPAAQIALQGAVESFCLTPVLQVITLHPDQTIDDVEGLIMQAWECGVKNLEIYRDGCHAGRPRNLESSIRLKPAHDIKLAETKKYRAKSTA